MIIPDYLMRPSRLYHIEPIGLGSADVESLSGYIKRLSDLHMVTVGHLINKEIIPNIDKNGLDSHHFFVGSDILNDQFSNLSRDVSRILEQKTCNNDLLNLTMFSYQNILSTVDMFRKYLAWCPVCYEEGRESGNLYEKLIWHFNDVEICKEHQVELVHRCQNCDRQIKVLNYSSRIGYCDYCHSWLGLKNHENTRQIKNRDYWAYDSVGELLFNLLNIEKDTCDQFRKNVTYIMNLHNLSPADLSRLSRIPASSISAWFYGFKPWLPHILNFSYYSGYSVIELLTKEIKNNSLEIMKEA